MAARTSPAPKRKSARGGGFLSRIFTPIIRAISYVYLGLGRAIGALARLIGKSARDLPAAHRRDGMGLLFLAAAIITSAVFWFNTQGTLATWLVIILTGAVG